MILDEGMVWVSVLVTLCSVTSLSLGMELVVEEERKLEFAGREKISGNFRLRAIGRWSRITSPFPSPPATSWRSLALPGLASPTEIPGSLLLIARHRLHAMLIGHHSPSPLHPLGKGSASVTEPLWHSSQKYLLWGDSGAEQQHRLPQRWTVQRNMINLCTYDFILWPSGDDRLTDLHRVQYI